MLTKSKAQVSFEYIFIIAVVVSAAYTFLLSAAKDLELSFALGGIRQSINDYESINAYRITVREINYTQPEKNKVIISIRVKVNETYSADSQTTSDVTYYAFIGLANIFGKPPFPDMNTTYYESNLFNYTVQVQ